jgi:hypothetical protein
VVAVATIAAARGPRAARVRAVVPVVRIADHVRPVRRVDLEADLVASALAVRAVALAVRASALAVRAVARVVRAEDPAEVPVGDGPKGRGPAATTAEVLLPGPAVGAGAGTNRRCPRWERRGRPRRPPVRLRPRNRRLPVRRPLPRSRTRRRIPHRRRTRTASATTAERAAPYSTALTLTLSRLRRAKANIRWGLGRRYG